MHAQPFMPTEDDYLVYNYNRFQACRYGLEAVYVEPGTGDHLPLREHLLRTMDAIAPSAERIAAGAAITLLRTSVVEGFNDARWLREHQARERLLAEVIRQAALRFRTPAQAPPP
jgi:carboxylate-amine ligase